jgi:hypothetical protein
VRPVFFALLSTFVGCLLYGFVWMGAGKDWFSMPTSALLITAISIITTTTIYTVLVKTANPQAFINVYLLTIVMKLGFYLALLLIIRFIDPQSLTPNALFLVAAYLLFTVLEVGVLFAKVNQ